MLRHFVIFLLLVVITFRGESGVAKYSEEEENSSEPFGYSALYITIVKYHVRERRLYIRGGITAQEHQQSAQQGRY